MDNRYEKIYISHINIRESISLLLAKLLFIEIVSAVGVVVFHTILFSFVLPEGTISLNATFGMPIYIVLVIIKTSLTIYLILLWLTEYYEVSSKYIMHRRGVIFKKEEKFSIKQVSFIEVDQGFIGRLLNFGTINLLNIRRYDLINMYMIHNPFRYAEIIKGLCPRASEANQLFAKTMAQVDDEGDL